MLCSTKKPGEFILKMLTNYVSFACIHFDIFVYIYLLFGQFKICFSQFSRLHL